MKNEILLAFLLFICILSCRRDSKKDKETELVPAQAFWDVDDLKKLKDTSQFIARISYFHPFKFFTVIESEDVSTGLLLKVKQPVHFPSVEERMNKPIRSLAFNQLCYSFNESDAIILKKLFNRYNNRKIIDTSNCLHCLDKSSWEIEIYDHGVYSHLKKDFLDSLDMAFTDTIFARVNLTNKNAYSIDSMSWRYHHVTGW